MSNANQGLEATSLQQLSIIVAWSWDNKVAMTLRCHIDIGQDMPKILALKLAPA